VPSASTPPTRGRSPFVRRVQVHVTRETKAQLARQARKKGLSVPAYVRQLVVLMLGS
jgi:hypothetical protein